jgi:hypothetical protein
MKEVDLAENAGVFKWREHKFLLLVAATIVVSLVLVGVAMGMYASSGAAQLDLSRPNYQAVREQADRSESLTAFPANGKITKDSLGQFRKLYDEQSKRILDHDSFGGSPLSDQALGLDAPAPTE